MKEMKHYGESSPTVLDGAVKCWIIFCGNWGPRRRTGLKRSGYDTKLFRKQRKHDSAYNFGNIGQMQMKRLAVVSS